MPPPILTLLTDFGSSDAYVGIMKGVILGICPEARLVDLTHEVPPQNVTVGALLLRSAVSFFPPGAIHLAVVDPGVGSERAAVLVETERGWLVGPDNGLLFPAASALGIRRVREIANPAYRLAHVSQTFHGRDLFAPAAAHLAAGSEPVSFGPERSSVKQVELPHVRRSEKELEGEVIHVDHFGNLVTNVVAADLVAFPRSALSVSIRRCSTIPVLSTYAQAPHGALVAVIDSWGHLEVAVRDGSAAARTGGKIGTRVIVAAE